MIDLTIERALQLVSKIWAEESEQQQNKANNVFINKQERLLTTLKSFTKRLRA